jgi:hypothetical protein
LAAPVGVVEKIGDRGYDSRAGKFTPVGGLPIFLTDGARDASAGTMVLRVTDETPYKALFADDEVILINTPGLVGWDVRWMWVQPGTVTYGNKGDQVRYPYRSVTIPYRESADPDKDFEPAWTYGDAKTYWGSQGVNYGALKTKYATYLDLKTDTRI